MSDKEWVKWPQYDFNFYLEQTSFHDYTNSKWYGTNSKGFWFVFDYADCIMDFKNQFCPMVFLLVTQKNSMTMIFDILEYDLILDGENFFYLKTSKYDRSHIKVSSLKPLGNHCKIILKGSVSLFQT